MSYSFDKIQGMLLGCALGDALGAPHEFRGSNFPYTGILQYPTYYNSQYQGRKELSVAQITDDTEMTMALIYSLVKNRAYVRDDVIQHYGSWANSGGWMIGKNTRALFRYPNFNLNKYNNRIEKIKALPLDEISQSNGFLMRCSPLAMLRDNNYVLQDVSITNPHPINYDCGLLQVSMIRLALWDVSAANIWSYIEDKAQTDACREIITSVKNNQARNLALKKGWCLHGLYCSMIALNYFNSFQDAIDWIISNHPGSDTDTNGAIAGALMGALIGYEKMKQESRTSINIAKLLGFNCLVGPTPRPIEYSFGSNFEFMSQSLYQIFK